MAIGFLKRGYKDPGVHFQELPDQEKTTWEKKAGEVPRQGPHTYYVNWNMDTDQHGTHQNRAQKKEDFVIY